MFKMQSASSLVLVLAAVLVSPFADAAEYRVNYEVEVKGIEGSYTIRTAEALGDDGVISQEIGPYKVVLAPTFEGGDSYTLEVSVSHTPQTAAGISPFTSRSFRGSLGGPLEFSGEFGGVLVTGAIMLHVRGGVR